MNLQINNKKLKVKYILGNYRDLDTWPTAEDVMYLLVQWAMLSENNGDTFTDIQIEKKFSVPKDKIKDILGELEEKCYIVKEKDTNIKSVYKIQNNPFN